MIRLGAALRTEGYIQTGIVTLILLLWHRPCSDLFRYVLSVSIGCCHRRSTTFGLCVTRLE